MKLDSVTIEQDVAAGAPPTRSRPWLLLRVLLCLEAVDVLAQAVLAGRCWPGGSFEAAPVPAPGRGFMVHARLPLEGAR